MESFSPGNNPHGDTMHDAETINRRVDILALIGQDTSLRKAASTSGGEWSGPCPLLGCRCNEDGFRVQPYHGNGGRWFCRGCGEGRWHSAIDYVMRHNNVDFVTAMDILSPGTGRITVKSNKQEEGEFNRQQWTDTSLQFIKECTDHLHGAEGRIALKYLHEKRGLDDDILEAWNIGYNPAEGYGDPIEWGFSVDHPKIPLHQGITIPCQDDLGLHYIKIRRRTSFSHDERYKIITGGNNWLYGGQTCKDTVYALIFEGEFSVLLSLRTGFTGIGYVSLPASHHLREEYGHYLDNLEALILAQDFDEKGEEAASNMLKLSPSQFHRALPLPSGKDIGEYYLARNSSLEAVFQWLYDQLGLLSNENKP